MFVSHEGKKVPSVTFPIRVGNEWKQIQSDEIFNHRTVVVFSLPGAFTPTCSSTHLPRYNELASAFFKEGVDEIVCISVNDTFVMNEWAKDQEAEHITMIPDGNGTFTSAMNMLVDKSTIGFGMRSWRYSMLVKNGVVVKQFIEPDKEGDPFEVSDADTMLNYINPQAKKPDQVAILTREGCPHCIKAKAILKEQGYNYAEIVLPVAIRSKTIGAITQRGTVPQVFINGLHIGGADELENWVKSNPSHAQ
ncbi:glutathione peroxidase [Ferrovum sp. PN-J185]|uniref:glutathione peroxidase n=1 Tax=Ferrovum sp. PN-J185 TaxID=1356306 RepID=UPI0007957A84|nr:glutathione peroxidase [Ferrovum sp. PN-J185]KXW56774.1 hybrid peroxiredoxin hyPrx5 [Ferrovum sp. PN-J185]MCC6067732.1 glutathione peroxidase [Ferrovum sp. PN-J185]MDE1891342.1 glutathione peroxidase [Betaproteobacteria bacterium]MDE2056132.1 glutathione peroxidase [Betaproteobacteria bacterium]